MRAYGKKSVALVTSLMLAASLFLTGCGDEQAAEKGKTAVKAMKIVRQDAPVGYSFPGQLKGTEEVLVYARVSGSIV